MSGGSDCFDLLHQKSHLYHVSIRKQNDARAQSKIRESNIKMLKEYKLNSIDSGTLESQTTKEVADLLAFEAYDAEFRAAIMNKQLQHLLFDKLMESYIMEEKLTIIKGIVVITKNSLKATSLLIKQPQYIHFVMKELEQIPYKEQTECYLDLILEFLTSLTSVYQSDFNYFLEELHLILKLGMKIRTYCQEGCQESNERMVMRSRYLLVIMENILCIEKDYQVKSILPQIVMELHESSHLYKYSPVNLLAVFGELLKFVREHREMLISLFEIYNIKHLENLQKYYDCVNVEQESVDLTRSILKIIPQIAELGWVEKGKIFMNEDKLVQFYIKFAFQKQYRELQKIAWGQLENILLFFGETLRLDSSLLENMIEGLIKYLNVDSLYNYQSLSCLNTVMCMDLDDSRPSKFKYFQPILSLLAQLFTYCITSSIETDLQMMIFQLLQTILECGATIRLENLGSILEFYDFHGKLGDIQMRAIKEVQEMAEKVKARVKEVIESAE